MVSIEIEGRRSVVPAAGAWPFDGLGDDTRSA
jgi:hypothetical protein